MGGKSKKAERAKDNARPSSSSHCAELLGNNIPIFFDFSTSKDSFFGSFNDSYSNIDVNFQIVLKKMNKKDSVTRLKALQEFTDLCKNSECDVLKAILPFWPRLYCLLCTDVEHRVREAAHIAHGALVGKVKKSISPYLKQLSGPWFTSQYDCYPPAATAATQAFEQVFPSTKIDKVLIFCQDDIINYIYESLINQTPQTLNNPKITKPEELEAKYQRIVIASLQGYNLYLQKLSSDQIKQAADINKKLVSSPKFWECSKSKISMIRYSFFQVLITLCQNAKFLLDGEMKRFTVAIFNDLDDSDPVVMASVWDAALNALVFLDDCWDHISFEKQVFPKLNAVIKKGGRNALTIFPSILPLLSKIPSDLITDKLFFYGVLLRNMRLAMESSNTTNISLSERNTVVQTFIECLKYIVKQFHSDVAFCNTLISDHLIKEIEKKFVEPKSNDASVKIALFRETSNLIRYWHLCSLSKKTDYFKLTEFFWQTLVSLNERTIESESSSTRLSDILENQWILLKILQNPHEYVSEPKQREDSSHHKYNGDDGNSDKDEKKSSKDDSSFENELLKFTKNLAVIYLQNCGTRMINDFIPYLNRIVRRFDSRMILEEFLKIQNGSSFYSLFSDLFFKWIENPFMRKGELIDLSFSLLPYIEEREKEMILKQFFEYWSEYKLQHEVCRCLLLYSEDSTVKSWIKSEQFSGYLLGLIKNLISSNPDDLTYGDIIITFFKAKDANGESVIDADVASSIMDLVSRNIRTINDKHHLTDLAQDLILNIDPKLSSHRHSWELLIIALFKLSCYYENDEKLLKSCAIGLSKNTNNLDSDFVQKLSSAITEIILNDNLNFSMDNIISRINYFIDLTVGCNLSTGRCSNIQIKKAIGVVKYFLKEPASITKWRKRLENCCFISFQNVGEWDLKFVELKEKQIDKFCSDHLSNNHILLKNALTKLICDFDNKNDLTSTHLSIDHYKYVLSYYRSFSCIRSTNESLKLLAKAGADIVPEIIIKLAKWNMYIGRIINLMVSAHPKSFKASILSEDWSPYYVNEEELNNFKEKNPNSDILPLKITNEEKQDLIMKLKSTEDFDTTEFEEKINILPICGEIFDLIFSVGLFICFNDYFASTKYYQILERFMNDLKQTSTDLLFNANSIENNFIYFSCKYFVLEDAKWRMLKTALQKIFLRNFLESESNVQSQNFHEFINKEMSLPVIKNNILLKLWYFTQKDDVYDIDENEWNRIFIYLNKFFENFKFEGDIHENDVLTFSILSRITVKLLKLFGENYQKSPEVKLCPEACLAWNEVVKTELSNQFFTLWRKLAEKWHDKSLSPEMLIMIQTIGEIISSGNSIKHSLVDDKMKLLVEYTHYITSSYNVFQITSFHLMLRLVPDLVQRDTETFCNSISQFTKDVKESSMNASKYEWTCKKLEKVISHHQGIVEALLSDFVIGDCCTIEAFTDSFNFTYSYLMIWCFILEMCGEAHSSLRFQYGSWLRDKGFANILLELIFKILPQNVMHGSEVKDQCQKYFENFAVPSLSEPVKSERIEQVACYIYRMLLQRLPNIVREWWSQSENKTSTLVDKITSLYVSPILIANELKNIYPDRDHCFDNMEIKTHPSTREIVATYTIDEVNMDLIMTLPQNYPLGTIKIESSNVVVSTSSQRNWLFHISKYLIHQNGSLSEALIMWKNNLDKRFEGVEECYICASILQGSTFETPRACCQICKKKFHSHCLYKWFSTSNNSSCPICRNLF